MTQNNFSDSKALIQEYEMFGKVLPFHDELQKEIVDSVSMKTFSVNGEGLKMMDIGAGYGFTTKLMMQAFPNADFVINEYDAEMCSVIPEYLGTDNFDLLQGDIEEVIKKIPSGSVDVIYSAWVLHNFPKEKRAMVIAEIGRVLKKGGIFVTLDKIQNPGDERRDNLSKALINCAPFYEKYNRSDLYLEWIEHYLRDEKEDLLYSDDEQEEYLKKNNMDVEYGTRVLLEKITIATKK